jgi:membrane fusion protein, multidrug efflux system
MMDGDLPPLLSADSDTADALARARRGLARPTERRPTTVRRFTTIGLLLVVVLGGLWQFNRFRSHAIANFFAHNQPPPAVISAVTAKLAPVPHFAQGIGSLAAVQQVTLSPQVGGLVTKIYFTAGEDMKAGDPLVQLDDGPDRADLANYQAQARYAQIQLARNLSLAKKQFVSQDTVDQNQAQLDEAQAGIAKTEAIIAQKLIRAPFAGRLGLRQVNLGQYLSAGAPIATLTNLSTLYVNFSLPSTRRSEIAVGQPADVTSDAFPGRVFHAKITAIEPQISADTRMIQVQATMANPDDALLPGMFVTADVVLPKAAPEVVLPATAVDYTLYGDAVFLIRPAGKDAKGQPVLRAWRTPVKTGDAWGGSIAILDGIKPGDRVVAAGQLKVQQNGAAVAISDVPPPPPPAQPTLH